MRCDSHKIRVHVICLFSNHDLIGLFDWFRSWQKEVLMDLIKIKIKIKRGRSGF